MKLSGIEFLKMLPELFREDMTVRGLAAGIDTLLHWLYTQVAMLGIFSSLEALPENVLDQLAVSLNIPWYSRDADRESKASIIRSASYVWSKLGTPSAVESVMADYYGAATLSEWFEDGSEPYTFSIVLGGRVDGEAMAEFTNILTMVKNARSHLEGVFYHGVWGYFKKTATWGNLLSLTWQQVKDGE